jgi:hypothetical protein
MRPVPIPEPVRTLSRRHVLGGLTVAIAATLPGGIGWAVRRGSDVEVVALRLAGLVHDPTAATRLGVAYLEHLDHWPPLRTLVEALLPDGMPLARAAKAADATLRQGLAAHDRSDLLAGRLASYDGWLLSDTAGRLGAVALLTRR